ncbi:MAG: STAS domain-containing protein [Candidatus Dactylopiibacterium sp.]|nr:STAS domain-containing protein [Candidatus Dactylopiibacterium sp.]
MVLPFFGKKPHAGRSTDSSPDVRRDESSTFLDFTRTGDSQRSLADAAGMIRVTEVSIEDVAAVEEAAVLYANASEHAAQAVLEEALQGASRRSERLWNMLFDLYRLIGDPAAFEARGVIFAQEFEKSPPIWQGATPAAPAARAVDAAPAVNLSGALSSAARNQFEQLLRIGAKTGKLRIDFSRLRGIDETGCELLAETLDALARAHVKVSLLGARHALDLIRPQLVVGEPQGRAFWRCALAMLQQLGEEGPFEDMAVDFAITFEESPPSWVPPAETVAAEAEESPVQAEEPAAPAGFVLEGIVAGPQPDVLRELADYAAERTRVEVDASALRRLEFVSAGSLFNLFAGFKTQGKQTVIRHPNEMVAALMRVMGIDQVAEIEYRKL